MLKNNRGKYLNIQQTERYSSPVSSQWKPGDAGSHSFRENSHRFSSYQSVPSSSVGTSSAASSVGAQFPGSSIRNSAHSHSSVLCLQQFRWCVACYESKFITLEPVLFIVMFAVYLHKIVFELYTFTAFARHSIIEANDSLSNNSECISTRKLNNVTFMESRYDVDGLLWSNRTGDHVEADTGILMLMVSIALGVCSVFGTLMLGPLSNRFGRKPALATILGGMLVQVLLTTMIIEFDLDVHYFVLGAALRGLTGGVAGVYTVSYSYITEFGREWKKWLVVRIGVVETLSFIAVSLGLVLGGVAIYFDQCNFMVPAYLVLGCILGVFLYSMIATADSRHHVYATSANRSPLPRKLPKVQVGPRAFVKGLRMFVGKGNPRSKLWLSLSVMVMTVLNSSGMTAIITLFLLHSPLVWSPLYIGGFLGMSEFLHGIVLVVVLPLLLSVGVHDGTIVTLSVLLTISMNITLAFVEASWQVFLGEWIVLLLFPSIYYVVLLLSPLTFSSVPSYPPFLSYFSLPPSLPLLPPSPPPSLPPLPSPPSLPSLPPSLPLFPPSVPSFPSLPPLPPSPSFLPPSLQWVLFRV